MRIIALLFALLFAPAFGHEHSDVRVFMIRSQIDQAGPDPIVFVGDSITEAARLPAEICGHPVVNAGIGGATISGIRQALYRIGEFSAAAIVVAIGTNDAIAEPPIDQSFRFLLDELRTRSSHLVIVGIPPIGQAEALDPVKGSEVNETIARIAGKGFVNVRQALVGSDLLGDGVHLNPRGYRIWLPIVTDAVHSSLECAP